MLALFGTTISASVVGGAKEKLLTETLCDAVPEHVGRNPESNLLALSTLQS